MTALFGCRPRSGFYLAGAPSTLAGAAGTIAGAFGARLEGAGGEFQEGGGFAVVVAAVGGYGGAQRGVAFVAGAGVGGDLLLGVLPVVVDAGLYADPHHVVFLFFGH